MSSGIADSTDFSFYSPGTKASGNKNAVTDYTIESIVEPDVVADATRSDYSAGNKV